MKRTPLYARHAAAGARFVPFAGFDMPVQYTGLKGEHLQVRSSVGLFDVSHMGEVRFRGPRAAEAVSWILSNDVASTEPGQAQYSVMCNATGGVVDDVMAYRVAQDDFLVCVNASNREKDFAWMSANNPLPTEVEVTDEGDDWVQIAVQGPNGRATVAAITDDDVMAVGVRHHRSATVAGVTGCIVARTGYTGEDGFEVFVPSASGVTVWDALMAAGASYDVAPIGLGARDTLRLETRLPLYGHELSDDLSPLQARLKWATKPGKAGGFLGADAIAARASTDSHFLCGILLEGSRIGREGMKVLHGEEEVGWVTSGTRAPSLGQGVCLAYVRRGLGRAGTHLTIDVRGRTAEGVVVKGPFYRRPA